MEKLDRHFRSVASLGSSVTCWLIPVAFQDAMDMPNIRTQTLLQKPAVALSENVLGILFKVEIDIDGHPKVCCIGRNKSPAICRVMIKLLLNIPRRGVHNVLFVCEKLCVVDQRFKFVFLHLFLSYGEDDGERSTDARVWFWGRGRGISSIRLHWLVMPIVWDRMSKPCERTTFTWVTARQTPADIVVNPIGSCNQPSIEQAVASPRILGVA